MKTRAGFASVASVAAIVALTLCASSVGAQRGLIRQAWTIDGVQRTALVAAPQKIAPDARVPLVFVFHGHGGSSANAARSFHTHESWPEAVVIYPQGLPTVGQVTDPEGKRAGWQHTIDGEGGRDLELFDAMLKWAREKYPIDEHAVFVAGHSNGGSITYVLWAARGDLIAAVAPSSSVFKPELFTIAKPKPAFIVAGRKDPLVPFAVQQLSLQAVLRLNRANQTAEPWSSGAQRHAAPAEGADVIAYVHPGGHAMPGDSGALIVRLFKEVLAKQRK
jgi:polyhydroxybutyrate depolymerase